MFLWQFLLWMFVYLKWQVERLTMRVHNWEQRKPKLWPCFFCHMFCYFYTKLCPVSLLSSVHTHKVWLLVCSKSCSSNTHLYHSPAISFTAGKKSTFGKDITHSLISSAHFQPGNLQLVECIGHYMNWLCHVYINQHTVSWPPT